MNTFYIYFFGLIGHLGRDGASAKDFAALVHDDEHFPFVAFEDDEVELTKATTSIVFRLNGQIDPSHAFTDRSFDSFVPSMKQVMGGTVLSRQEIAKHAILVEYPKTEEDDGDAEAGTLSVGQLYGKLGRHRLGGNIKRPFNCVARLTVLPIRSSAANLEVLEMRGGSTHVLGRLEPGQCVLIGNMSFDGRQFLSTRLSAASADVGSDKSDPEDLDAKASAVLGPDHFRRYGVLLNGENSITTVDQQGDCPHRNAFSPECQWIEDLLKVFVKHRVHTSIHLECGNSAYP